MTEAHYVIARAPREPASPGDPQPARAEERRRIEGAVAEALGQRGRRVVAVPHVYFLGAGHPAVERLLAVEGRLVVASWLHPRAAYWTLRALGLPDPEGEDGRSGRIRCVRLGAFETPAGCAAAMEGLGGSAAAGPPVPLEEVAAPVSARWYPVLDYARCEGCGKCMDFCFFGVYARVDERVVAAEPDRCKDGCPACARLCPQGAILFPHHAAGGAIAGEPGATLPSGQDDLAAFLDPRQAEKERAECADDERDDLDDLMDALDDLDD